MTGPHYGDDSVTVWHGDCLDVLPTLADASVDAICTDPPYDLTTVSRNGSPRTNDPATPYGRTRLGERGGFMGKTWDGTGIAFRVELWAEALRVLKPGGHLVAFGGTRTYHRLVCAIEDAGFEIRDSIGLLGWTYASGFPKSLDVSKAIDKAGGDPLAFRAFARAYSAAVVASPFTHADIDLDLGIKSSSCYWAREDHRGGMPPRQHWERVRNLLDLPHAFERLYEEAVREDRIVRDGAVSGSLTSAKVEVVNAGTPSTDAAHRWNGWGTALKPAWEPIVLARRPLAGTVAGNVLAHGTGALNIDGCRIEYDAATLADRTDWHDKYGGRQYAPNAIYGEGLGGPIARPHAAGRWPTNVVLTHAPLLDADGVPVGDACAERCVPGCPVAEMDAQSGVLTSGANPTRRSSDKFRDAYGGFKGQTDCTPARGVDSGGASRFYPVFRYEAKAPAVERPRNGTVAHPCVKPLDLMRWLVRLVTPPGGLVLDMFAGSGTTGEAAVIEGFRALLIEREADYLPLIAGRLSKPISLALDIFGE